MGDCCSHDKCSSHDHSHHSKDKECGDVMEWFLKVADEAWTEVLKEEIKKHIWETQGDRMRDLGRMVSEANSARWQNKMDKKRQGHEFKAKICNFFGA